MKIVGFLTEEAGEIIEFLDVENKILGFFAYPPEAVQYRFNYLNFILQLIPEIKNPISIKINNTDILKNLK